jgi:outer membrane protein assembly factor BamB
VVEGVVYVGSDDRNLYALDASTGAKLWSHTIDAGVGSSPAVSNGVVYIGGDYGNVYALNAKTGAELWRYVTRSWVYFSSPAVSNGVVRKNSPYYGPERFTYEPESNRYICPAGQPLNYGGRVHRNRAYNYIGTRSVVVRARKEGDAPVQLSALLSSTGTNRLGNGRGCWRTHQSSPMPSGKERRWKPYSRNSRIRLGCGACACGD